jgi:hypothetical protein
LSGFLVTVALDLHGGERNRFPTTTIENTDRSCSVQAGCERIDGMVW